jgi:hypothetical protein
MKNDFEKRLGKGLGTGVGKGLGKGLGKSPNPTVYSLFSLLSRFKAYKLRLALLMLSLP